MIGPPHDNPDELYVTACGETFRLWAAAAQHEQTCPECGAAMFGEDEREGD
jgi:transcription initiation factor IIE alpha subunit